LVTKDYRAHCTNCGFTVPCEIRPIGNIPFIFMRDGTTDSDPDNFLGIRSKEKNRIMHKLAKVDNLKIAMALLDEE
jgi:hypothetical protein